MGAAEKDAGAVMSARDLLAGTQSARLSDAPIG
jgi:hypothetical protein